MLYEGTIKQVKTLHWGSCRPCSSAWELCQDQQETQTYHLPQCSSCTFPDCWLNTPQVPQILDMALSSSLPWWHLCPAAGTCTLLLAPMSCWWHLCPAAGPCALLLQCNTSRAAAPHQTFSSTITLVQKGSQLQCSLQCNCQGVVESLQ